MKKLWNILIILLTANPICEQIYIAIPGLLHLIAHYEMGNYQLVEYLIKSVYRFMAKMKNLNIVEEEIFHFLRKSFSLTPAEIFAAFKPLKEKLEKLQGNPLATRSFMYLDIIGWLESKIENVPVQQIIRDRYLASKKNRQPAKTF